MSDMRFIATDDAPAAIGPYSQAVEVDGWLYVSGQIPFDPKTMKQVEGGITEQTHQVMKNLAAILKQAGGSLQNVVKTTVFLSDMENFAAMNAVYAEHMGDHRPARAAVEAANLPRYVDVEIECIAKL